MLEREHGRQDASLCLLLCVLYYMEGEFEQIVTKIRWSVKENNNYTRGTFRQVPTRRMR